MRGGDESKRRVRGADDLIREAGQRLGDALDAAWPRVAPCRADDAPDDWFSEHAATRAVAAEACGTCPVLDHCGTYADLRGEQWGVWGGIDREVVSPSTRHRRKHAATEEAVA